MCVFRTAKDTLIFEFCRLQCTNRIRDGAIIVVSGLSFASGVPFALIVFTENNHRRFGTGPRKASLSSSGALELERHIELRTIGFYFSFGVQLQIEFDDLCDSKISERFCGFLNCVGGGLFPDSLLVPISSMTL